MKRIFELDQDSQPQVYGIGLKELWDIPLRKASAGLRPLHPGLAARRRLGRRLPVPPGEQPGRLGLRRRARLQEPTSSPFEEFQRWKQHPSIREHLEGGRRGQLRRAGDQRGRLAGGAEARFPGGALIGCAAGFVNVPRIKGSHTAMKSGMLAAEAAFAAIAADRQRRHAVDYEAGCARAGSPAN